MLLSLAGIPLTAGFFGKFYAIMAGLEGGVWWLVMALLFNSAVGIYYYLRWLLALFDRPASVGTASIAPPATSWGAVLSLALLTSLLLWLGVYPSPLMAWIQSVMAPLTASLQSPVAGISF